MSALGLLSGIFIYPVKSLPGIYLQKAICTKNGLAHPENIDVVDRKWMLIDENYSFLSQRKMPKMALIHQRLSNDSIILSAPGKKDLKIAIKTPEHLIKCRLWSTHIECYLYEQEISSWLSDFLEQQVHLVSLGNKLEQRNTKEADFNTFMLISEASLSELNSRLSNEVTMRNFRPNLITKNCTAFDEDNWTDFKIGDSMFTKTSYCIRCLFTTVDPDKGIKSSEQQPLKTLKEMRKEIDTSGPLFGIYLNLSGEFNADDKQIQIGDQILKI